MEEEKPSCVIFTAKAEFTSLITNSVNIHRSEEMGRRYIGKPGLAESHQL
jgi:hypothetical protein